LAAGSTTDTMLNLSTAVLAASTVKSIGAVIAVLVTIAFVWYIAINVRAGRGEIASEIELAPNRQAPVPDEVLEGPRLDGALRTGLLLLAVVAIGLPLYWLAEPSRQEGAITTFSETFVTRGSRLFAPTAEGGYNCAGCHGDKGVGGVAPPFTLTGADGKFVSSVSWYAPALNTVLLRFSQAEVKDILTYGRPGTPMPAWGTLGGGPLTDQQLDELVAYLGSIQLPYKEAQAEVEAGLRKELGLTSSEKIDYADPKVGEALFNLGLGDGPAKGTASGAFSCGRCHTKGASFLPGSQLPLDADLSSFAGFPAGSGALGPSLRYPIVPRQFLSLPDLLEFIRKGSVANLLYGQRGQGSGRMPGFGDNPNTLLEQTDGMFTDEMLQALATYEANLHLDGQGNDLPGAAQEPAFTIDQATTTSTTSTTVKAG
jgi:mono/diheme cytochrome c family protein